MLHGLIVFDAGTGALLYQRRFLRGFGLPCASSQPSLADPVGLALQLYAFNRFCGDLPGAQRLEYLQLGTGHAIFFAASEVDAAQGHPHCPKAKRSLVLALFGDPPQSLGQRLASVLLEAFTAEHATSAVEDTEALTPRPGTTSSWRFRSLDTVLGSVVDWLVGDIVDRLQQAPSWVAVLRLDGGPGCRHAGPPAQPDPPPALVAAAQAPPLGSHLGPTPLMPRPPPQPPPEARQRSSCGAVGGRVSRAVSWWRSLARRVLQSWFGSAPLADLAAVVPTAGPTWPQLPRGAATEEATPLTEPSASSATTSASSSAGPGCYFYGSAGDSLLALTNALHRASTTYQVDESAVDVIDIPHVCPDVGEALGAHFQHRAVVFHITGKLAVAVPMQAVAGRRDCSNAQALACEYRRALDPHLRTLNEYLGFLATAVRSLPVGTGCQGVAT